MFEGWAQGEALEERGAERVHVGAPVDELALGRELFRRHVGRGADEVPRPGQRRELGLAVHGEPEVEDHRRAVRRDHDVPGLDVAVDDPLAVGHVEGAGGVFDLTHHAHDLGVRRRIPRPRRGRGLIIGDGTGARIHRLRRRSVVPDLAPAVDLPRQAFALYELHRDVREPARSAGLVDRADPGMIEAGSGGGLALEADEAVEVEGELSGQDLQGDLAMETGVDGAEHLGLSAAADSGDHAVRAHPRSVRHAAGVDVLLVLEVAGIRDALRGEELLGDLLVGAGKSHQILAELAQRPVILVAPIRFEEALERRSLLPGFRFHKRHLIEHPALAGGDNESPGGLRRRLYPGAQDSRLASARGHPGALSFTPYHAGGASLWPFPRETSSD